MNSISRALNNIALSLNAIANAINNSKKVEIKPSITSNPISSVTITKLSQEISEKKHNQEIFKNSFEKVTIPKEEKEAIDAIYNALIMKGDYPHHHDHVVREMRTKWPVLFRALDKLTNVRKKYYNDTSSSNAYTQKGGNPANKNIDIWDYKAKKRWQ